MIAPADPATFTFSPRPSPTKKWDVGCGITWKAGVPLGNVSVKVSPATDADVMPGVAGADDAGGNAAEAGPDGVQAGWASAVVVRAVWVGAGVADAAGATVELAVDVETSPEETRELA
jgi:hypothetical protein